MKIAQIAPLSESVPPRLYGGTERVVSYLTEELVGRGMTLRCSPAATSSHPPSCFRSATRPFGSIPG